ncbi:hypothetical protein ILUMI_06668 [Ignelater luminosus]|uniref:Endonuclease/exonuclease/phosphatase domain-containing protein n=1 Tax=Ignelater luminosus TaxID=2038154 RepID=A0A8K0D4V8_IGNLU|nr:hypothetical protein ILUMI_06668 [Ignelater luminosus]
MVMAVNENGSEYRRPLNGTGVRRISQTASIKFAKASEIKIGTWNALSMYEPGKMHNTIHEMERMSIAVLGISEMRWPQTGKCQIKGTTIAHIIDSNDEIIEDFYNELQRLLRQAKNEEITILMEDLNAKVGQGRDGRIIGDFGHDLFHLHKKVNEITDQGKHEGTDRIENQDGNIILHNDQQLLQWKQYIQELFADERPINHGNAKKNIEFSFEKCGIVPLNSRNVIECIPEIVSQPRDEPRSQNVDKPPIWLQQKMRGTDETSRRQIRTRIAAEPGRSVPVEIDEMPALTKKMTHHQMMKNLPMTDIHRLEPSPKP